MTRTQIVEMMIRLDEMIMRAENEKIIEKLEQQKEVLRLQLGR